jgi:molecular chaperone DnaK (HSP70)
VIIGEPAIRDETWKANFRRHIREVFEDLRLSDPFFFPEPFAVFQYYRHVEKNLPVVDRPEIILILDIGGGTFNSCIIRTTEQGLLARGGATSVPLGLQAEVCGGAEIDKNLLKRIVEGARKRGVLWKDDPIGRVLAGHQQALLRVEDAKIYLSNQIAAQPKVDLTVDYSQIRRSIVFPAGELHPEQKIVADVSGEDLKTVIRDMWRR